MRLQEERKGTQEADGGQASPPSHLIMSAERSLRTSPGLMGAFIHSVWGKKEFSLTTGTGWGGRRWSWGSWLGAQSARGGIYHL